MTLKVENLPPCDEEQLRSVFEPFGIITSVVKKGSSAIIKFDEEEDCLAAIQNINGYEYFGKILSAHKINN
ncbi:hypothetical protein CAAN1_05S06304 [[Candida] anglica]|uniref:RRM domain-containing protein n=1 Tax=[Candida] anglica TaxID=148631 RepID=A0ABP0ED95_9ASCO